MLRERATIRDYDGQGTYGPEYGPAYETRCRAEFKNQVVRNQNGDEVIATIRVFFLPEVKPPPGSLVTIRSEEFEVIETRVQFGLSAPSHTEVMAR